MYINNDYTAPRIYVHSCICTYTYTLIQIHTHEYIPRPSAFTARLCSDRYIHAHTHTQTHTHTHTDMRIDAHKNSDLNFLIAASPVIIRLERMFPPSLIMGYVS